MGKGERGKKDNKRKIKKENFEDGCQLLLEGVLQYFIKLSRLKKTNQ